LGVRFIDERQQQVLKRGKLVPPRVGICQRRVNGLLKSFEKDGTRVLLSVSSRGSEPRPDHCLMGLSFGFCRRLSS
jgi:hypothetical protein